MLWSVYIFWDLHIESCFKGFLVIYLINHVGWNPDTDPALPNERMVKILILKFHPTHLVDIYFILHSLGRRESQLHCLFFSKFTPIPAALPWKLWKKHSRRCESSTTQS